MAISITKKTSVTETHEILDGLLDKVLALAESATSENKLDVVVELGSGKYMLDAPLVFSTEEHPGYCTDDASTTLITFKSGITASFMCGCYSKNGASWDSKMTFGSLASRMDYRLTRDIKIYGIDDSDKAALVAGTISGDGTQVKNDNEKGITVKNEVDFGTMCDRTFIDAVITGDASKIRSPYEDAMKTVALCLACNESMRTGLPVKLG